MSYEVVFVGGPLHGERRAMEGEILAAPAVLRCPRWEGYDKELGEAVYNRAELADTPGAITYVYEKGDE